MKKIQEIYTYILQVPKNQVLINEIKEIHAFKYFIANKAVLPVYGKSDTLRHLKRCASYALSTRVELNYPTNV